MRLNGLMMAVLCGWCVAALADWGDTAGITGNGKKIVVCGTSTRDCPSVSTLSSTTMGANIGAVLIRSDDGKEVVVNVGTANRGDCPAGWTNCGDGQTPAPPASTSATFDYGASGCINTPAGNNCGVVSNDGTQCVYKCCSHALQGVDCDWHGGTVGSINASYHCPTGYSVSGSSCNLQSGQGGNIMKPSDGRCTVVRTGNVYGADPQDPDCGSGPGTAATKLNLSISGAVAMAGSPTTTLSATINATTGGTAVTASEVTGAATTTTYSAFVGALASGGSSGSVGGTSLSTAQGTGSGAGSGGEGGGNCGAPGQPPCRIDETGTPAGSGFQESGKTSLDALTPGSYGKEAWDGKGLSPFSGLPTLSGSDSCTNPITWIWMGRTIIPDLCTLWSPLKPWLSWLLYAWTALYVWRRVTGALSVA